MTRTRSKPSLKYLGVIIDGKLSWKDHLDYMSAKVDRLILRMTPMCWSRGIWKIKDRLRLYRQVFISMLTYGFEVWFPGIREKSTYLNRITKLQRRVLRAILGAYKNASTSKLMELAEVIPIEAELQIRSETRELERDERGRQRSERRERWRNQRERIYDLSPNFEFREITRREAVWALTETGPMRAFLAKIGKEEEDSCRLCGSSAETVQHLLFECEMMSDEIALTSNYSTNDFERAAVKLINLLRAIE